MKISCRKGIFETNSSASHCICITNADSKYLKEKKEEEFRQCYIYKDTYSIPSLNGYMRHPFEILMGFHDKIRYALCEYCGYFDFPRDNFDEYYERICQIIKEYTGAKDVNIYNKKYFDIYLDKNGNPLPYQSLHYERMSDGKNIYYALDENGNKYNPIIDKEFENQMPDITPNEEFGLIERYLKEKGITLKEFLTDDRYIVVIDGDEYCDFQRYYEFGLIDHSFILDIYPDFRKEK